jgi:hypothetical protein
MCLLQMLSPELLHIATRTAQDFELSLSSLAAIQELDIQPKPKTGYSRHYLVKFYSKGDEQILVIVRTTQDNHFLAAQTWEFLNDPGTSDYCTSQRITALRTWSSDRDGLAVSAHAIDAAIHHLGGTHS